ncbi:MAG: LytR/AlgR family response regulator transcription factor [Bacteroidia bacterium]
MNCILVDDDLSCIKSLNGMLQTFVPNINVVGTARQIADAVKLIHSNQIDLVFLDIEIQQELGFDLLRYFPSPTFEIIFTTAHEKYALRAIRSSCFDYLLKPIDAQELVSAVSRFEKQKRTLAETTGRASLLIENLKTERMYPKTLALPVKDELVFIPVSDLVCLEGDAKYTTLHIRSGSKLVSSHNIGDIEDLLDPELFFRCHRSWIINLKDVVKFLKTDSQLLLSNNVLAEVSTRKKDEFLRLFSKI